MNFIKNMLTHLRYQVCKTLIWLGIYKKSPQNPWRCAECGSSDVQELSWVDRNTGKFKSIGSNEEKDRWCEYCEAHTLQVTESELMEDINYWWKQLDGDTTEIVTNIDSDSYSSHKNPEKAHEKGIDRYWNNLSTEQKISIWKYNTYDNRSE